MKNAKFINPDTRAELEISIDADIVFVYGGNGTGKTTLSRSFNEDNCAVFNTDFISRNVYVVTQKGANVDKDNKENFSQLFLGSEAVELAKQVEDLTIKRNEMLKEVDKCFQKINEELRDKSISPFSNWSELTSNIQYEFSFDGKMDYLENKKKFRITKKLSTQIDSEEDFDIKIKMLREEGLVKSLKTKIEENKYLNQLFISSNDVIPYIKIDNYNNTLEQLSKLEQSFNVSEDTESFKHWISEGLELHTNATKCYFCANELDKGKLLDWEEKLTATLIIEKKDLINELTVIKKSLNLLLTEKEVYKNISPKILDICIFLDGVIDKYLNSIVKKSVVEVIPLAIGHDPIWKGQTEAINDSRNYYTNKSLDDLVFLKIYYDKYCEYLDYLKNESIKNNESFAMITANKINEISKKLGFSKLIKVDTDNRGARPKISLIPEGKAEMNHFSDGQRHKLALAVFFAKVVKSEREYEIIVLDDPVISLDVKAYHALKTLLMSTEFHKAKHLLVLTHNLHYLYVQTSNLIDNNDIKCKLYEIFSDKINEIPMSTLKEDDLSLFKKEIQNVDKISDVSRIYWMSSKIARTFLDFKLRTLGIASTENLSEEIVKLEISEKDKGQLQKEFNFLSNACRRKDPLIKDVLKIFSSLNIIVGMLGFDNFITESELQKIINLGEENCVMFDAASSNTRQEIILNAREIHFDENPDKVMREIKNYINHPRHQITESLLVIRTCKDQ